MKKTINHTHFKISRFSTFGALALAGCFAWSAMSTQGQTQTYWLAGSGTGDFNVASNWSAGKPASGFAANNDTSSNNIIQLINGDAAVSCNAIKIGISNSGSLLQSGSTITLGVTQSGYFHTGQVTAGSVGYYTIMSNAVLNTPFGITVGEVGNGVLNIWGGTINVGTAATTNFVVNSDGNGSSGIVNQTNGTVNCSNQLWISQGPASSATYTGTGTYNLSGGTLTVLSTLTVGRAGGNGIFNITGGTVNAENAGVNFAVGSSAGFAGAISTGVVNQSAGTINCDSQFLIPVQAAGTVGTYNLSGTGVLNVTNWLAVGRTSGTGYLNMSGGVVYMAASNGYNLDIGASGPGTLTQTGGAISNTVMGTWIGEQSGAVGVWTLSNGMAILGQVTMGVDNGASGTLNLAGGLFQTSGIKCTTGDYSLLDFNGGTLQANANNSSFISGLAYAQMDTGGAVIDSQGYTLTIPQQLIDHAGGGLTKVGSGSLTLTGANSYIGPTMVNAGTLATTTASTGGGSYTVADGATLSVAAASANGQLNATNVTLGSTLGANLTINLSTFGNPTLALLNVPGTLTLNGTNTLTVASGMPIAAGQFPLVSYVGETGSGSFVLGALPVGEAGYLSNNMANSSFDLVITSAGAPRWNGTAAGGFWDIGISTNWIDEITSAVTTYRDGEPVLFDDNAAGTTNVVLNVAVNPGSVTFNNTLLTYTLSGTGEINGGTGLLMEGSNTVSILNTGGNGYTGPTVLDAGTLAVTSLANGGSPSAIGASSASSANLVLAGGTLNYSGPAVAINRGYSAQNTNGTVDIYTGNNLTLSGAVTAVPGSGFNKGGPAQLTYANTGTNTLSDTLGYDVTQGAVLFGGSGTNYIVGHLFVGNASSTNAAVTVTNGATVALPSGGNTEIGVTGPGVMSQAGGTFNAGTGQIWVGQGSNGVGTYNLSGGTFIADDWLAIGRANGSGTFNLSGSAVLDIIGGAGTLDIGTSATIAGDVGTGTFNQTGGTISNSCPTWLGEGASGQPAFGVWNMSGGSAWLLGTTGSGAPASLFVGQSGIGTNVLNLSGTAAITCQNYVSIGHLSPVVGDLNIGSASQPGGSLTMSGTQDFNVGDSGNGVLTMVAGGGGQLTVPGTLYLTRSSTASGTVNLNGGMILAGHVNNGYGFGNNLSNNAQAFNFNGGTLKALGSSSPFIQPFVNTVVEAGGAIIDDGGFTISISSSLTNGGGGGGLTKLGNGTLYLSGANTYTGTTVVSNGTLGCSSSINGPVVVASGGTLTADTGSLGTCTINSTLTLQIGSTTSMKIAPAQNDQFVGLTAVSYGGNLVVTNTSATSLTIGHVYQLFNSAAPGSNNFSSVTVLPSGAATFNPSTGTLTIINPTPVTVQAPVLSGSNMILTGGGSTPGSGFTLLTATNLTTPLSAWTTNSTGNLDGAGSFSNSIPINTNGAAQFFILRQP